MYLEIYVYHFYDKKKFALDIWKETIIRITNFVKYTQII